MKIISVINQKGGTGKTTVAINIAAELHSRGDRILLIDADDVQKTATTWAGLNGERYFEVSLKKTSQIEKTIERNQGRYDYVIIDCPPRADEVAGDVVANSHIVVLAVPPSPFDVWACGDLVSIINARKKATAGLPNLPKNGIPLAVFLFTLVRKRTRLVGEIKDALADSGIPLMQPQLRMLEQYKRAPATGHTIHDAPEKSEEALFQVKMMVNDILERLKEYG